MSANSRRAVVVALALLGACQDRNPSDGSRDIFASPDTDEATVNIVDEQGKILVTGTTPMAWRFKDEPAGPAATYGDGRSVAFAIRCDRAAKAFVLQRAGGGAGSQAEIEITTSSGGITRYDGDVIGGANPRVEARTDWEDPFLDKMAAPAARLTVTAEGGEPAVVPGGRAVRRVVEACRAPAPLPVDGPVYTGTIPCADCPGIDVRLVLTAPDAPQPRYRITYRYRERGTTGFAGGYSILQGERGPIFQLVPEGSGETIFLEQIAPDRFVYRTPANERDAALDRYPLVLAQ